jgi:hypothetical protein
LITPFLFLSFWRAAGRALDIQALLSCLWGWLSMGFAGNEVFSDQRLLSIADLEHSEAEECWFSVGHASNGMMLSVVLPLVGR